MCILLLKKLRYLCVLSKISLQSQKLCVMFCFFPQWLWEKSSYSLPIRARKSSAAVGGETECFILPRARGFRGGVAIAWICKCMKVFGFLLCERKIKVLRLLELSVCLREGRSMRSSALERTYPPCWNRKMNLLWPRFVWKIRKRVLCFSWLLQGG